MEEDNENRENGPIRQDYLFDGWDKPSRVRKPGKTYSPHYKGDNSGGYGNPPVSGQKKKGDAGGPGRPRGSTSLTAALNRAFRRKLPIVRDGKATKLHPTDILAERILEAILAKNPSPSMIELGRKLMEQYGPPSPEERLQGNTEGFSHDEMCITGALLTRLIGEPPEETRRHVLGTVDEPYPLGEFRIFRRADGHIGFERLEADTSDVAPTLRT